MFGGLLTLREGLTTSQGKEMLLLLLLLLNHALGLQKCHPGSCAEPLAAAKGKRLRGTCAAELSRTEGHHNEFMPRLTLVSSGPAVGESNSPPLPKC